MARSLGPRGGCFGFAQGKLRPPLQQNGASTPCGAGASFPSHSPGDGGLKSAIP